MGRDRIQPGEVSPELEVPTRIPRPHYVADKSTSPENAGVQIHTKKVHLCWRCGCCHCSQLLVV